MPGLDRCAERPINGAASFETVAAPPGFSRPVDGPLPPRLRPAVDGGSPSTGAVGLAASSPGFCRPVHGPLLGPYRPAVNGGAHTPGAGGVGWGWRPTT